MGAWWRSPQGAEIQISDERNLLQRKHNQLVGCVLFCVGCVFSEDSWLCFLRRRAKCKVLQMFLWERIAVSGKELVKKCCLLDTGSKQEGTYFLISFLLPFYTLPLTPPLPTKPPHIHTPPHTHTLTSPHKHHHNWQRLIGTSWQSRNVVCKVPAPVSCNTVER